MFIPIDYLGIAVGVKIKHVKNTYPNLHIILNIQGIICIFRPFFPEVGSQMCWIRNYKRILGWRKLLWTEKVRTDDRLCIVLQFVAVSSFTEVKIYIYTIIDAYKKKG